VAAAAMIAAILISGFMYFSSDKAIPEKGLATFTKEVKKLDEVQKESLIEFIDGGLNTKQDLVLNNNDKPIEIKNLLQGVSEEELINFQEQSEDIEEVLMLN
jgi:hypothetical protein